MKTDKSISEVSVFPSFTLSSSSQHRGNHEGSDIDMK